MARRKKLTGKEAKFVAALPKCNWVGTDAVIMAEYDVSGRKSASEISSQLLKKTQVREAVDRMMDERLRRAGIYAEKVLLELGKIGFSDISKAYNENGTLKDPKNWPEELRGVIAGVEIFEEFSGRGEEKNLIGYTKKIRTYDKVKSLELLAKHLKLFPTERRPGDSEPPPLPPTLSKMELSAKLIYILQLAIQRQKENEDKESENLHKIS